ncbi:MAG TPA: branched-chain alpha-keto acid dehydrogenase subunit E2, partial [Pseudomonas sp.]|nr:branched-chain alpha-keto acid dehydrogenase subunit E2 [Pseudomonas sp.]
MGTHVIKMPDIGEGIAEVELSVWHVKVGDMVVEDQVLADVMTDKAMVDIPSPVHGKVIALGGVPGEVMAVGSILISIEVEGAGNVKESAQPAAAAVKQAPVAAPKAETVVASKPVAAPRPAAVCEGPMVAREANERPLASPAVRKHALDLGIQLRLVRGTGPAGL